MPELPEPYWTDGERTLYHGDCLSMLPSLADESVGLVLTDPPYGWSFMGRSWDSRLPDREVWSECLRVLKPGGFAFVFCGPRLDGLWRMGRDLEEAGFDLSYSPIFWTYLSGFPKGLNLSKAADKAAGAEREVVGRRAPSWGGLGDNANLNDDNWKGIGAKPADGLPLTAPATPLAERLDGWFYGRQALKPAVEVVIVAQRPLSEKTGLANVVKHSTGGLNCGECAIPCEDESFFKPRNNAEQQNYEGGPFGAMTIVPSQPARFPANLCVTGNALGPRSKYFDCEKWFAEHVTLTEDGAVVYCPKASRAEKERGLDGMEPVRYDKANGGDTEWEDTDHHQVTLVDEDTLPERATTDSLSGTTRRSQPETCSPTFGRGSKQTDQYHKGTASTTSTERSRTTDSPICNSLLTSGASDTTADVGKQQRVGGSSCAESAERSRTSKRTSTSVRMESTPTAKRAASQQPSKPSGSARRGCVHPTCKPLALLCWLTVLGCPPGETILDPFAGSGTGGCAAKIIGRKWIGCELQETEDEPYCTIASKRIAAVEVAQRTLFDPVHAHA